MVPGLPENTNQDAQIPYINLHKTIHIIGPQHSWITSCRWKILFSICSWLNLGMWNMGIGKIIYIFIEKYPHIKWPTQFKLVLFKGQLEQKTDLFFLMYEGMFKVRKSQDLRSGTLWFISGGTRGEIGRLRLDWVWEGLERSIKG